MTAPATATGKRIRLASWLGFLALVAISQVVMATSLPSAERQLISDALTYLAAIALTCVASTHLAFRIPGIERRLWGLMALAMWLLLASELYLSWYFYAIDRRGPQLPAPFEILQLGAAIAFLMVVDTMVASGRTLLVTRLRFSADVLAGVVVVSSAVYWWVMLPLYRDLPRGGWQVAAVQTAYGLLGAVLFLGAAATALSWTSYRWRTWERLLVGALGLSGLGMMLEPIWYSETLAVPNPPSGGILNSLYGIGFYLLFVAVVYRATSLPDLGAAQRWPVPSVGLRWLPMAFPVAIALMLPVLGLAALRVGGGPGGTVIVVFTCMLAGLLIVRSWLSSLELMHLRDLTITDPVSGAFNHRYLHERLAEQLDSASPDGLRPALIVFDVDDFGHLNRVWGHQRGDEILRAVAEQIAAHAGPNATVYRVGSDEFAVLVVGHTEDEVVDFAKRTQSRVAAAQLLPSVPVTVSCGIALYPTHGKDVDQIVTHALSAQQLARVSESAEPIIYDAATAEDVDPSQRSVSMRRRSHRAVMLGLAAAVDERYPFTKEHSENVAQLAVSLAQVLGLSEDATRLVGLAARVHDVGKIGVRDEILLKEGPLSSDERALMQEHPVLAERILAPTELEEVLPLVRHHHERWDGGGYPDGLRGPQIPVGARILAVCDAFEAMTAPRPYREPLMFEEAVGELESNAGSQFDPDIAGACVRMVTRLRTPVSEYVPFSAPGP